MKGSLQKYILALRFKCLRELLICITIHVYGHDNAGSIWIQFVIQTPDVCMDFFQVLSKWSFIFQKTESGRITVHQKIRKRDS